MKIELEVAVAGDLIDEERHADEEDYHWWAASRRRAGCPSEMITREVYDEGGQIILAFMKENLPPAHSKSV